MANESQKINKFIQFHYKYCSIGTYSFFFFFFWGHFFVSKKSFLYSLKLSKCFSKVHNASGKTSSSSLSNPKVDRDENLSSHSRAGSWQVDWQAHSACQDCQSGYMGDRGGFSKRYLSREPRQGLHHVPTYFF